mgnify:CR=1 FL=1
MNTFQGQIEADKATSENAIYQVLKSALIAGGSTVIAAPAVLTFYTFATNNFSGVDLNDLLTGYLDEGLNVAPYIAGAAAIITSVKCIVSSACQILKKTDFGDHTDFIKKKIAAIFLKAKESGAEYIELCNGKISFLSRNEAKARMRQGGEERVVTSDILVASFNADGVEQSAFVVDEDKGLKVYLSCNGEGLKRTHAAPAASLVA